MVQGTSLTLAMLTAALWIVPSVGTKGMGTLNQRVVHPDARLVDDGSASRGTLARLDSLVEGALRF